MLLPLCWNKIVTVLLELHNSVWHSGKKMSSFERGGATVLQYSQICLSFTAELCVAGTTWQFIIL